MSGEKSDELRERLAEVLRATASAGSHRKLDFDQLAWVAIKTVRAYDAEHEGLGDGTA
jgi:hypothetical protein